VRQSLTDPALRRIAIAYVAFNAAEWATWIAMLVFAFERAGVVGSGTVAVIQLIPSAIFAPLGATFADRYGRLRVLTLAYAIQALAIGATAVALERALPLGAIYALAAVGATSITLTRPAQSGLLPSLASTPEALTAANGTLGAIESAGILAGPLIAGALLSIGGAGLVYAAMAIALAAGGLIVAGVRAPLRRGDPRHLPNDPRGLRALAADRPVLGLIGILATESVQIGALDVLFVAFALGVLGIGDAGVGLLSGALGLGGVLGAAATAALVRRRSLSVWLAAGALSWGGGLATLAAVRPVLVVFAIVIAAGAARGVMDVSGRTLLQRAAPPAILARVFGILEGLQMAALAIGAALAPLVVETLGVPAAFLLASLLAPASYAFAWRWLRGADAVDPIQARQLELVENVPAFARLPLLSKERVARALIPVVAAPGETIVREGEAGERFFVIDAGEVEISIGGTYVRVLRAGATFGELALLHEIPRTATARARGAARLYALEREEFLAATSAASALAQRL
jgi:MFS family permease